MCTLIALHGCVPGAWLVVAANRDEGTDRPAEPPALRAGPRGPIVAPRDRLAGGTWLGLNAAGIFAAITNRAGQPRDGRRRSRGLLVLDALAAASARDAMRGLAQLGPKAANPFNLFVADAREAFVIVYDEKPRTMRLAPGVHVIGNGDPDAMGIPKVGRLRSAVDALPRTPPARMLEELAVLCRGHAGGEDPLESVCIHAEGYGTRSSTLLWLGDEDASWLHAEGPPCRNEYQDFTPLLGGLRGAAQPAPGELLARGDR